MKKNTKIINNIRVSIVVQGVASQLTLGYGYLRLEPRGGLMMGGMIH